MESNLRIVETTSLDAYLDKLVEKQWGSLQDRIKHGDIIRIKAGIGVFVVDLLLCLVVFASRTIWGRLAVPVLLILCMFELGMFGVIYSYLSQYRYDMKMYKRHDNMDLKVKNPNSQIYRCQVLKKMLSSDNMEYVTHLGLKLLVKLNNQDTYLLLSDVRKSGEFDGERVLEFSDGEFILHEGGT